MESTGKNLETTICLNIYFAIYTVHKYKKPSVYPVVYLDRWYSGGIVKRNNNRFVYILKASMTFHILPSKKIFEHVFG